jgi:hypothetical protein
MRTLFRIIWIIVALFCVSVLGYYAYTLSTDTLRFPFAWQEKQQGDTLRLTVARPSFFSLSSNSPIFDIDSIKTSLRLDGKVWDPTVSGEATLMVSGEYIEIRSHKLQKNSTITLDADVYNKKKVTSYRIPRSVSITRTDTPRQIDIQRLWEPRDTIFAAELYWYPGFRVDDLRWYIHHDSTRSCDISAWDSQVWDPLTPVEISRDDKAQISRWQYRLSYDTTLPYTCIIAGLGWDYIHVLDEAIGEFTATGVVASMLSPEYDLQSELEFRFSHDIFSDTGTLYSDEYIDNRHREKVEFYAQIGHR